MNVACYVQRLSPSKNSFPSDTARILEVSFISESSAVGVPAWEPNVQRYLSVFGPSCPSFLLCGLTLGGGGKGEVLGNHLRGF